MLLIKQKIALFFRKWFKRGTMDSCYYPCFRCRFKNTCDIYKRLHSSTIEEFTYWRDKV